MTNDQVTEITLKVNGEQAAETLDKLKARSLQLADALEKAAAKGDQVELKKLKKEVKEVNNQMRILETSTQMVERVMSNLSSATPKELKKTVQLLEKQLNLMKRGSEEWKAQVEKIKKVKGELDNINSEMKRSVPLSERINNAFNKWSASLMTGAASITGIVMAGREAVKSFAEMEQEMANVRKYTGMSADDVERLNEEFKKMNTRTSREDLNKLAQEAGRLGMSSQDDVVGFVRAADKINVALDELGEGATLTISKLTDIFGDKNRMGVEYSMLAVGSAINELSQNSTASAPYLAEFAQRLAGVGAQADMTIPQIMGLAAVLDSQGQQLEMSASAVSKLITDMFKNTDKICKATGLNVKQFSGVLKKDTNEALMVMLERLNELGDMSVLAPVFAEMGEDGVRASAVMAALAGNVDTVRKQQLAANDAFHQATSVVKEYEVQNNTVQAGLDKAKKNITEISVELGQQLMPVMSHVITKTSMLLRLISATIDFVKEHKAIILSATTALVGYTVVTKAHEVAKAAYIAVTKIATKAQEGFNKAMSKNLFGLIAVAIASATVLLKEYIDKVRQHNEEMDVAGQLSKKCADRFAEEKSEVMLLTRIVNDNNISLGKRREALEKLNQIVPEYNGYLDNEGRLIRANTQAIDDYLKRLETKMRQEAAEEMIKQKQSEMLKKQMEIDEARVKVKKKEAERDEYNRTHSEYNAAGQKTWSIRGEMKSGAVRRAEREVKELEEQKAEIKKQIDGIYDLITSGWYGGKDASDNESTADPYANWGKKKKGGWADVNTEEPGAEGNSGKSTVKEQKFAKEKEWLQKEEALLEISYAKRKKTTEEYEKEMLQLQIDYANMILKRKDLTNVEKLETIEKKLKAVNELRRKKVQDFVDTKKHKEEYNLDALEMSYLDGRISKEEYELKVLETKAETIQEILKLYKENDPEYAKYQEEDYKLSGEIYKAKLNQKRQDEKNLREITGWEDPKAAKLREREFAKYMEMLDKMEKREVSIETASLKNAEDIERKKTEIAEKYEIARLKLKEKYGKLEKEEDINRLKEWTEEVVEWLNSDYGQAVQQSLQTMLDGISSIFSGVSELLSAQVEAETGKVETKYDSLLKHAEGNKNIEVRLEEQKEKEIAAIKNEAEEKMYGMQIAEAIAQTAMSAIAAYQSAAAVPMVGWMLAPAAAAMAIAAGGIQIAAIKQQHEAAMSQGYASGGYTRKGRKYEEAGVVHAGEWVAPQEMVNSPVTGPIIGLLETARRSNTIATLNKSDVSRSINAPAEISRALGRRSASDKSSAMYDLLLQRLNEPIVAVTTVTGDKGIKQAYDEYDKLIANKTRK